MEREAVMSLWVGELECQLESTLCESQDWAAKAIGAWVVELLMAERATAAERGLDAAKVHQVETKAALQKSLEALEMERKAQSEANREVLVLWGQVLGTEESNARLLEKVTR